MTPNNSCSDSSTIKARLPLAHEPTRAPHGIGARHVSNNSLLGTADPASRPLTAMLNTNGEIEISDAPETSTSGQKRSRRGSSKPELVAQRLQQYINSQSSFSLRSEASSSANVTSRRGSFESANPNESWQEQEASESRNGETANEAASPASEDGAAAFLQMLSERSTLIQDLKSIMDDSSANVVAP